MMNEHDKKNCHQLLDSLSEYVDGDLNEALCSEIEKHIDSCEDCRIVVDTLKKTIYLYHATAEEDAPEVPAEVRERLYHRLDLDEFLGEHGKVRT